MGLNHSWSGAIFIDDFIFSVISKTCGTCLASDGQLSTEFWIMLPKETAMIVSSSILSILDGA